MTTEITYRISDSSGIVENKTKRVTGDITVNITYRIEGNVTLDPHGVLLLEDGVDAFLIENGTRLRLG